MPDLLYFIRSSGLISTTIPELAKGEFLSDGDMPFTTTSSCDVAEGTIKPPGHMQNE